MALQAKDHAKATRIRKKLQHGERVSDAEREFMRHYETQRAPQGRRPSLHKGESVKSWIKPKESAPGMEAGPTVMESSPPSNAGALASIAAQDDSPPVVGGASPDGKCPGCGNPIGDADKRCAKCGIWVRFSECQKCHKHVTAGEFCSGCGTRAPVPPTTAPTVGAAPEATAIVPAQPQAVHVDWKPENAAFFADIVNGLLELDDCEPLDDDEKQLITERAVPVLNRYMKFGGAHGELIQLGVTVGMMAFPRLWIRHIVEPMREKKKKEERAKAIAEAHASQRARTEPKARAATAARLPDAPADEEDDS